MSMEEERLIKRLREDDEKHDLEWAAKRIKTLERLLTTVRLGRVITPEQAAELEEQVDEVTSETKARKVTRFMDMHSGGGSKEKWDYIYIEAPESEAIVIFYNRFGHSPHRVTCTCCGTDYSIYEEDSLEEATEFDRDPSYDDEKKDLGSGVKLSDYLERESVLLIRDEDIKPNERTDNALSATLGIE